MYKSKSNNDYRFSLPARIVGGLRAFENVLNSISGPLPHSVISKAQGILIFREYESGFTGDRNDGFGIAMQRQNNGQWGPPAFLEQGKAGNFPMHAETQRQDLIFLFMNRDALKLFDKEKFKIAVGVSVAAGPLGANARVNVGAPILVYSDSKDLYAGALFKDGMLLSDNDSNDSYYGRQGVRVPEILRGENINFPTMAGALRQELENYEVGPL